MKQIVVNQVCRAGSTCIKEIEIGNKVINSVQTLPKLQSKNDVKIFFDSDLTVPHFDGVVLDLWSIQDLSKALFVGEGQRRLEDNGIAVTKAKYRMDEKAIIIDPNSEEFHYPYPLTKDKVTGVKTSRLDVILSLKKFPILVKDVFATSNKDTAWRTLESKNLLLSYIDWYVQYCLRYGANIILPPTPLVNGKQPQMIEIMKTVNEACQKITRLKTDAYPATYVPIMSDAFADERAPQRIMDAIFDTVQPHSILALKFYRADLVLDNVITRRRLREFLMAIDALKKEIHDSVAVLVLDTKAEGVAYFGNGVDLTCDPLGGVKDRPNFGKRSKREDTGDETDDQKDDFGHYGKWYHPDMREYLKIKEIKSILSSGGNLPHDCEFCKGIGDAISKEKDEPGFPKQDQWNAGRRIHNYMCRREEDEIIRDLIKEGDTRAINNYLSQAGRGNKNLVDLLP